MKQSKYVLIIIFLFIVATGLYSLEVPALQGYVNDYAGILSSSEEQQISQIFSNMEKTTKAQGVLLTIPTLEGESIESFSIKVAEAWKLGHAEEDNGLLILLAMNEKKVRIEVGYGLESLLTDAKSGYIIREVIIPEFKKGNFANGLYQGAAVVSSVIGSTTDISSEEISSNTKSRSGIPFNFIFFILIFAVSSIARRGRRRGGIFQALFLGSMLSSGSRRHRGFGGGSFGGGFSGGGGGFGGGGGGFGGGGASGGW
jgi:uncharacterized protein